MNIKRQYNLYRLGVKIPTSLNGVFSYMDDLFKKTEMRITSAKLYGREMFREFFITSDRDYPHIFIVEQYHKIHSPTKILYRIYINYQDIWEPICESMAKDRKYSHWDEREMEGFVTISTNMEKEVFTKDIVLYFLNIYFDISLMDENLEFNVRSRENLRELKNICIKNHEHY